MDKNLKILICGFMGAGKSTFLERLKRDPKSISFSFTDLDELIKANKAGRYKSLGDYIRDIGIDNFRDIEFEALQDILTKKDGLISLGGGTLNDKTIRLIAENKIAKLVYLSTSFEVCYERIMGDENRPMANQDKASLKKLYEARSHYYEKSDLILNQKQQDEITLDQLVTKLTN